MLAEPREVELTCSLCLSLRVCCLRSARVVLLACADSHQGPHRVPRVDHPTSAEHRAAPQHLRCQRGVHQRHGLDTEHQDRRRPRATDAAGQRGVVLPHHLGGHAVRQAASRHSQLLEAPARLHRGVRHQRRGSRAMARARDGSDARANARGHERH